MALEHQNLDIINAACAMLGADPVQSLEDDVDGAGPAGVLYQHVVDFNLAVYPFTWARRHFQLSVDDFAGELASGYRFAFDLPPDRLGQPLYITDTVKDRERRFHDYALVGDKVHADRNPLWAFCAFRPDPKDWDPLFRLATITAVASALALPLTSDRNARDDLARAAYGNLSENFKGGQIGAAIRSDAFSTPPRPTGWAQDNVLVNARRGF